MNKKLPDHAAPAPRDRVLADDPEIAALIARERARVSQWSRILVIAGIAGIVAGGCAMIWYQTLPPDTLADVVWATAANMVATLGLLIILLGLGFIGLSLYIRRRQESEDNR